MKLLTFLKPISKIEYLKNIQTEPIKDLIKELNTTLKKENSKTQNIVSDNIVEEMEKIINKKKVASIKPLHVKYEGEKKQIHNI